MIGLTITSANCLGYLDPNPRNGSSLAEFTAGDGSRKHLHGRRLAALYVNPNEPELSLITQEEFEQLLELTEMGSGLRRVRPLNQGLESIGSAVNFQHYVEKTSVPLVMPLLAKSTQDRYMGVLDNYLIPAFGLLSLRDLTPMTLQRYFSHMVNSPLSRESKDKIRDVLASVLSSAMRYGLLISNPTEGVQLPKEKRGRRQKKPHITPEQFDQLVNTIPEPYATMVYVAI